MPAGPDDKGIVVGLVHLRRQELVVVGGLAVFLKNDDRVRADGELAGCIDSLLPLYPDLVELERVLAKVGDLVGHAQFDSVGSVRVYVEARDAHGDVFVVEPDVEPALENRWLVDQEVLAAVQYHQHGNKHE